MMSKITYELMAIDVDGTLLNSENQISTGSAEALARLSEGGTLAVLISGRSFLMLQDYMTSLRVSSYYIGSGGAMVADVSGKVISFNPVVRAEAEEIYRKARQFDLGVCFHESRQQNCLISDPHLHARIQKIGAGKITFVDDVLASTPNAPEKLTVFGARPALEEFRRDLQRDSLPISMTFSGPNYLEICRSGVDKGHGLTQLIQYLGIPPEKVAAIGDQQNDLSMFAIAGLAIAMGNATSEVKSAADVVAPPNDEGGLAWAINNVVLA
jgi:Cof subfamily protein (haloacid dehalogenase superfamily)